MKFSILVPVYNVEKYIELCVESLLSQTYKGDYEIILVDDGSTDNSGEICDKLYSEYPEKIKVIHKENSGPAVARTVAVNNASGEFSLFVDSDDFLEHDALEKIFRCISKNPDTDAVIFSFNYFHNGTKSPKKQTLADKETVYNEKNKNELYESLISTTLLNSLCTKAVRTEILKKDPIDINVYKNKRMAEDLYMSIYHVTAFTKAVFIREFLYNYRIDDVSLSRSFNADTLKSKNTLFVYERFSEFLPAWELDDKEHRHKLNAKWLNETMYTFTSYYENCSRKDRKNVMHFDWSTMLPDDARNDTANPYENKSYRKLYNMLSKKEYFKIRLFFLKRHIYKALKSLKAKLKCR